jgi:hypothetical protein
MAFSVGEQPNRLRPARIVLRQVQPLPAGRYCPSETGDSNTESENLSLYLHYKPEDARQWVRLINLQIQAEKWNDANASLRKLKEYDRKEPVDPRSDEKDQQPILEPVNRCF